MQADLRGKDLYISELEGELQAKRKKISTLSGQLEQTENELERLRQNSKHGSNTHFVFLIKLILSPL